MSGFTDYFEEEYGISLNDAEITAFSENSTIAIREGVCMGLAIKWIQARLSGLPMRMSEIKMEDSDVLVISRMERIKAGLVQRIYGDIGAAKFSKNGGDQQLTDHGTIKAMFKSVNRIVGIDHQVDIEDVDNWRRLQNLTGVYLISCKGATKGHALAADLREPHFHFYDPDQFWLTFDSKDRFFEVLRQLTDEDANARYLEYNTWAWYRIM